VSRVPSATAERELLAPVEDVWRFLAEPRHLADWWPGIGAVEPDRRGLAPGARWTVRGSGQAKLLRRAYAEDTILIREVEAPARVAWHHVRQRLDVELALEPAGRATLARLSVRSPWLVGFARSLPRDALARLHGLLDLASTL
jgi:uncharacterized protein YndB with AHSA1/START domain